MSYLSDVAFTMDLYRGDDLAAAAMAARREAEAVAALLPDQHLSPAFEAPHVHRMLWQVAADPSRFVPPGGRGNRFFWGGSFDAFCGTGELRRPSDALWYLEAFVRHVAAGRGRDDDAFATAVLLVSPETDDTAIYVIDVDEGAVQVTDYRLPFVM